MKRRDVFLAGSVIAAFALVLLLRRGELPRADYLVMEVLGTALVLWLLFFVGNGVRCRIRDRAKRKE
jgi:hypothetical protein